MKVDAKTSKAYQIAYLADAEAGYIRYKNILFARLAPALLSGLLLTPAMIQDKEFQANYKKALKTLVKLTLESQIEE